MSQIQHQGKYFILGRQGREIAKVSESQLLACLEILKAEMSEAAGENASWLEVLEYLQDQRRDLDKTNN